MSTENNRDFLENLKSILKISKEAPVVIHSSSGRVSIGSHSDYHSVVISSSSTWQDFTVRLSNEVARQVARAVTEERLAFNLDSGNVKISSKGVKLDLPMVESSSTIGKLLTKFSKTGEYFVIGKEFRDAVALVKHAANDRTIGDIVLRGYHLVARDSHFELMASNGAVMAVTRVSYSGLSGTTPDEDVIYLLNPEFHQVAELFHEEVSVSPSEDTISFSSKSSSTELSVVTKLTQGNPAPYQQVIASVEKNPIYMKVNTKNLYEAVRRIDFFTDENNNNRVSMLLKDGEVEVTTYNQHGHSTVRVEVNSSYGLPNDGITLVTRWNNLVGFFSSATEEETTILVKDETSPILLKSGQLEEVIVLFYN